MSCDRQTIVVDPTASSVTRPWLSIFRPLHPSPFIITILRAFACVSEASMQSSRSHAGGPQPNPACTWQIPNSPRSPCLSSSCLFQNPMLVYLRVPGSGSSPLLEIPFGVRLTHGINPNPPMSVCPQGRHNTDTVSTRQRIMVVLVCFSDLSVLKLLA